MLHTDTNQVGNWVYSKLGDSTWNPTGKVAFGAVDGNLRMQWGVVYERFCGTSVYGHIVIEDPKGWTREAIRTCLHYPLVHLGVHKFLAEVNTSRPGAVSFLKRLGFVEEARIEGVYTGGDLVIFSTTLAQCKWLTEKDYG